MHGRCTAWAANCQTARKSIQADSSLEKGALLNYTDWKSVIESARTFNL